MIIICGPHGSGKVAFAKLTAEQSGFPLQILPMTSAIDASDLVGNFEQVDGATNAVRLLSAALEMAEDSRSRDVGGHDAARDEFVRALLTGEEASISKHMEVVRQLLSSSSSSKIKDMLDHFEARHGESSAGRFEWVDGPLLRAVKEGQWIVLQNANLCNPAVLDRLNSLTEMNGSITLSERGLVNGEVQVLRPHTNFRIIMTIDPAYGELSRAMRNRGVELFLSPPHLDLVSPSHGALRTPPDLPKAPIRQMPTDTVSSSIYALHNILSCDLTHDVMISSFVAQVVSPLTWNRTLRSLPHFCSNLSLRRLRDDLISLRYSDLFANADDRPKIPNPPHEVDHYNLSVSDQLCLVDREAIPNWKSL
jgi:MoxR-like ATPase